MIIFGFGFLFIYTFVAQLIFFKENKILWED
jgi:hypothetical protein